MMKLAQIGKTIFTAFYILFSGVYKIVLKFTPVKSNQVLFSSFPDFSDNSKALYQYMLNNPDYANYNFVWLIKKLDGRFPKNERTSYICKDSRFHFGISIPALAAISSSKILFYTHSSPIQKMYEKKGQTVVNLWHGCGYKARKTPIPKKKQFDYGLVPGPVFVRIKSKFWGCREDQVIPIGYPRYDQMRNISEETKAYFNRLKEGFSRVILWMPTYRKTERNEYAVSKMKGYFELPPVNSVEQLRELDRCCKENKTLLFVKRHPKQIKYKCEEIGFSNIKFINNQNLDTENADLYGLFSLVDGLISDYSSSAIDFLLMDKPIAFSLNDMEDYGNTQGFVFDDPLKYMPGHYLYALNDLIQFIDDVCKDKDPYRKNREAIICEVHNPCDNYCERICEFVMK